MTFTRPALLASPLATRLLGSASLGAMMLAVSFATTAPALAQEITGVTGAATNLTGGASITSGNTGSQFGVIDTDDSVAANTPNSITLTQSETIRLTDTHNGDAGDTDEAFTNGANPDFTISSGVTGTLIFAETGADGDGTDARLRITGDLQGTGGTQGGNLVLSVRNGVNQDGNQFNVSGNTNLTDITINAGDAIGAVEGGNIAVTFGNGPNLTFNASTLTVNGGDGANAGRAGGLATANVTTTTSTISGAVTVRGGDGGSGIGNNAVLNFTDSAGTVTIGGPLTVQVGNPNGGTAGTAQVTIASTTFSANGGIVLDDNGTAPDATLTLNGTTNQTVNGALTVANDGDGEINVANAAAGQTITFTGTLGTDTMRIGTLDIDNGDTIVFQGNTFANLLEIEAGATAQFQGTQSVLEGTSGAGSILVGDGTSAATLTFDAVTVTAHTTGGTVINPMGTLVINVLGAGPNINGTINGTAGDSTSTLHTMGSGGGGLIFVDDIGAINPIGLIDVDIPTTFGETVNVVNFDADADFAVSEDFTAAGNLDVATGVEATFQEDLTVGGDLTGGGAVILGTDADDVLTLGTAGQTSTVSVAILGSAGGGGGTDVTITPGSLVTITSPIGFNGLRPIEDFTLDGAGTVVTINSVFAHSVIGSGTLNLGEGTLILGSNVGAGVKVFQFLNDNTLITNPNETLTVQLPANFASDTITLALTGADQSAAHNGDATDGEIVATDNALNTYTIDQAVGDNTIIEITAATRTTAETAGILGVSTEQAIATRRASQSGDGTLVDLLSTALNAGGTTATQAAQQVGVQSEQIGSGGEVGRQMAGQQQGVTGDRIGGFRADDPRFVSAFASTESGIAAGDMTGLSSAHRYANSVWGQVYGGTALADGTTALAGFDAGFGGALIGIDGAVTEDIVIGAFAGYGFADVDGDGAGNAQLETSAYQAGVYAGYTGASFYVDAFAAYAMTQNDTVRTTLGNNTVRGEFDASQITVGLSGGAPIAISPNAYLTPNASLTWNHYDADGYTEVGVGANTISGFSANTLTGIIGARLHAVYEMSDGSAIIPELSASLLYDLVDDDGRASATFVGGGTAYTVSGTEISDIGAVLGAGLTMRNDTWSFGLSYEGDIRSDFMSHTARAELRLRF